jgi:hypothetical protein
MGDARGLGAAGVGGAAAAAVRQEDRHQHKTLYIEDRAGNQDEATVTVDLTAGFDRCLNGLNYVMIAAVGHVLPY